MASELTPEKKAAYLESGGNACPFCGSDDVESSGQIQADSNIAWQQVDCLACDESWEDIYTLTGVEAK